MTLSNVDGMPRGRKLSAVGPILALGIQACTEHGGGVAFRQSLQAAQGIPSGPGAQVRSPKRLVQLKRSSSVLKHDGEQKVLLYITQSPAKSIRRVSMKSPNNHAMQIHQL